MNLVYLDGKKGKKPMQKLENWNGNSIRFVEHNGEWWAVLSDITRALNLRTDKVRSRLEDDHLSRVGIKDRMGRTQETLIVNEFGIYEAIFSSRKKEAKQFKKWVFETIKQLRQVAGLEGFQVFRMLDKEHQKQAMAKLETGLKSVSKRDLIKANTIAKKAVSNKYGFSKMVGKSDMTESMLKDREEILDDTVELMVMRDKFELDFSVADTIYSRQ